MSEKVAKSEEQEDAEAEVESFREDLGPFVVAAETTRMAMIFTDAKEAENPIIFANDSFLKQTGYARDEVLGQNFDFLMVRAADPEARARIQSEFAGDCSDDVEVCFRRKDGSHYWADIFINPVRDEAGDIVQHFASFVDLTRHKDKHVQSRMLIDELNHRVKNTLSTVQSIVAQVLRNTTDPATIQDAIESRLFALSRSHDLLTRENWASAGLRDIIDEAMRPFGVTEGRAERFEITGENVRFPPKAALALGIAFHELATNAVKYGAFAGDDGCIRIAWAITPTPQGDTLLLHWREENGPPVAPPTRRGFGSRVIERGLAHELDGKVDLDFRPDGLVCTIAVPAPRLAHDG